MSHTSITFSPAGTPLPERTVGELVAERPGRSRIFQTFGIDFCCQGGRTLRDACDRKNVPLSAVTQELENESAGNAAVAGNPADLPPHELCNYIVGTHHAYLRRELPRLHAMADRVARVHGGHTPSLVEVFDVYNGLEQELTSHIMKEEQILFPAIAAMSLGEIDPVRLDGPISRMIYEHDSAGEALAGLRKLTGDYQPPADACNTYRALFSGLEELEEDLHRHIHLENSVLFPAAQAMMHAA